MKPSSSDQARSVEGRLDNDPHLQALFGQASAGIVLVDLGGRFAFVNARFCDMIGYGEAELLGQPMIEFIHPDDRERDLAHFDRLKNEGAAFEIEKRYVCQDGTVRWAHNAVSMLRDPAGQPQACFAASIDITARRAEEERLLALKNKLAADLSVSHSLYNQIIHSAGEFAIFTLSPESIITSWNPGSEKITGYSAAEAIGQSATMLFVPEELERGDFEVESGLALAEGSTPCERWHLRRDGSRYWASGVLSTLLDAGKPVGFLKIHRDATAERAAQEARRAAEEERARLLVAEQAARREAESASDAKDRFLAAISHELRMPLAPMQMAAYALARERRLSASGREMVKMLRRNLDDEVRLIDDLLDVSRIVHDKLELQLEAMDAHQCVHHAIEVCDGELNTGKLRFTVDLAAAHCQVIGDTRRLCQAFWNLLKNAAKFTPPGGAITVRSSNPTPDEIVVEVSDTGIGIEAANLSKIFSAFEQGNPQITQRFGGLGLGLAISRAVVHAHGGELTAASEGKDRGATFTVRLKLARAAE